MLRSFARCGVSAARTREVITGVQPPAWHSSQLCIGLSSTGTSERDKDRVKYPLFHAVNARGLLPFSTYCADMKHVTYGEKSVLMGDEAADTLLEYSRILADNQKADTVTLQAISPDGNTVDASFLLNASTVLMIESTNSEVQPPDTTEAVAEIQDRIDAVTRPTTAPSEEPWQHVDYDIPEPR